MSYAREDVFPHIERNEWEDRRAIISSFKTHASALLPNATRAVRQGGGDSEAVDALTTDEFWEDDVVDKAVAQLRHVEHKMSDVEANWWVAVWQWRQHVKVYPATNASPQRIYLSLADLTPPPPNGVSTSTADLLVEPEPGALNLLRVASDPGVAAFGVIASALAAQTELVAAVLKDGGEDCLSAVKLVRELRGARGPRLSHVSLIADIELCLDKLALPRATRQPEKGVKGSPADGALASRAKGARSRPKALRLTYVDVLGSQRRTRLRRLALLRALPARSNKDIVGALDEFGQDGPDDGTVSKDIKAMRTAGAIHLTKLARTEKGDQIAKLRN